jgi:hypothetical protein
MSIIGPRPSSGSPNYFSKEHSMEVRLLNPVLSNSTNCISGVHDFLFNDAFTVDPSTTSSDHFNGNFTPAGKLAEFFDASHANVWTLMVEDVKQDTLYGQIESWGIKFSTAACFPSNYWAPVKLASSSAQPPARYRANMVSHDQSLFVYGGRDSADNQLQDLYRFDWSTFNWTQLQPVGFFTQTSSPSASIGNNIAMTPSGLLLFGGYFRQRYLSALYDTSDFKNANGNDFLYRRAENDQLQYYNSFTNQDGDSIFHRKAQPGNFYDNTVLSLDIVTQRWSGTNITIVENPNVANVDNYFSMEDLIKFSDNSMYKNNVFDLLKTKQPAGRYLSAIAYVPSSALTWRTKFRDRTLFDETHSSYQANFQGTMSDSLIIFGGFDGATGSISDGSSGGFLSDLWVLRLNEASTTAARQQRAIYRHKNCDWRLNPSARNNFYSNSCMIGHSQSICKFRDLLMLLWCSEHTQTIA